MIWDKAAHLAEILVDRLPSGRERVHRAQQIHRVLDNAKLFYIPAAPHEFLPKSHTEEQVTFYNENFFLPFRTTAIEDKASLVILFDNEKHQRGLDCTRQWIEFLPWTSSLENFRERTMPEEEKAAFLRDAVPNSCLLTAGTIKSVKFYAGKKTHIGARIDGVALYDMETGEMLVGPKEFAQIPKDKLMSLMQGGIRNALQAIDEVAYFNDPSNFVLEEIPKEVLKQRAKKKSPKGRNKIARMHARPTYTVLRPAQIRRRMHLPEPGTPGGMKVTPHERRAHLRTFSDDVNRWPNKHGKTIVVKGSWIGPSESIVGGKKYKVLINMRPPMLPKEVTV